MIYHPDQAYCNVCDEREGFIKCNECEEIICTKCMLLDKGYCKDCAKLIKKIEEQRDKIKRENKSVKAVPYSNNLVEKCGDCKFIREDKEGVASCHRNPPVLAVIDGTLASHKYSFGDGFFPIVSVDNWCGQYWGK